MDKPRSNNIYEFEDFHLDAAHLLLYQNGRQISLAPKAVETLLALVERHGEVLSKDELMKIVWADSIVEEGNLSQNLYLLRKILNETADGKPLIETLKRRGYRFNGDVLCVEPKTAENSSPNNNQSAAPDISTRNHYSGVKLQGSVSASADRKINEPGEFETGDYNFQISEPDDAFQACQLARIHYQRLTPPDLIKSRALLEKAIRLDADYAPAYIAFAEQSVTEAIVGLRAPADCFAAAKVAIARASELNANSAEFYAAAGYIELVCGWNFTGAERDLRKSLEINSHHAYGNNYLGQVFMFQRRFDEAETYLRRARKIEPTGLYHRSTLMINFFLARNYQKLIEESEKTLALYPQFINAAQMRCWALEQTGRAAEAVAEYEKILSTPHGEFARRWIGYAYALCGDEENARATAAKLVAESREHYVSPIHLAMLYTGLNESDEACTYLEKLITHRDPWMLWLAADPRFDNLRSNVRLRKLEGIFSSKTEQANYSASSQKRAERIESNQRVIAKINDDGSQITGNLFSIVGREKEILQIKNLLSQNDVRLVTLAGVGGAGKTRLAQAVAAEMARDFSDDVFFVELAAITNSELIASTIAQTLGVKESGGSPIFEALKDYLRDKATLLVLDNFEQVASAAPQIAQLLAAAENIKILVTSRVLLHLSAETEFVVPPLGLPSEDLLENYLSAGDTGLLDELPKYESVELFVERARNARLNFVLSKDNARSVAEICIRLEGLPLAIELAAARVKIISPPTILAKLENRLNLLTGGAEDLPARRQTMRGAIAWSYDLLTEDEKRLFRQLAVFSGGFTFEAAEAVCEGQKSKTSQENSLSNNLRPILTLDNRQLTVLNGITSLIDKNLLVSKAQSSGELRFQMLETIREYALESLEKNNETEAARHKHAEYFLALGEEAEQHLQTARAGEWLKRLEVEHDNLRGAIGWLFENEAQMAARLAAAIRTYLINHNHLTEGREWLKTALEQGGESPVAVRFELSNGLGYLAEIQGDYETARKIFEKDLVEGRTANDKWRIAKSLRGLGAAAHSQGDYAMARKFHEEGLAIQRELNDKFGIAASLNGLGYLALNEGDSKTARKLLGESLKIFRLLGNESSVCHCLLNLGAVAYINSDYKVAQKYYGEVITIAQNSGYKDRVSDCLDGFAALAAKRGELEFAVRLAGTAERLREQIGFKSELADRKRRNAYLAELKTKMDEADFSKIYEQGRKLKLEEAIALCLKENETAIIQTLKTNSSENKTDENSFSQKSLEKSVAFEAAASNKAPKNWKQAEKIESEIKIPSAGNDASEMQTTGNLSLIVPPVLTFSAEGENKIESLGQINRRRILLTTTVLVAFSALLILAGFAFLNSKSKLSLAARGAQSITLKRLTPDQNALSPIISPDGRYLAYARRKDDAAETLRLEDMASGSAVEIMPDGEYEDLVFSPDGAQIYYLAHIRDSPNGTLFRIPIFGGKPQEVMKNVISPIAVSPDGRQIAVIKGDIGFTIVDENGGDAGDLLKPLEMPFDAVTWDSQMSWSPDGERVVICGDGSDRRARLLDFSVKSRTGRFIPTPNFSQIDDAVWLADGAGLIVTAKEKEGDPYQVWRVSYPSGEAVRITHDFNNYDWISLSRDSKTLVVQQRNTRTTVWLASFGDAENARQLTYGSEAQDGYFGLTFAPNGKIIFTSPRNGNVDLWQMNSDGGNQQPLTASEGSLNISPRVTSNGRYIVFASSRSGTLHVWRTDADGRNPRQMTNGAIGFERSFDVSPDGNWIYYVAAVRQRQAELLRISINGGEPVGVADSYENAGTLAASPDGKLLARYIYLNNLKQPWQYGIFPVEGGEPVKTVGIGAYRNVVRWTADGKSLVYIKTGTAQLWRQPIDGSPPTILMDFKGGWLFNFAVSPDYKQIAFARGTEFSEAVLIDNLGKEER